MTQPPIIIIGAPRSGTNMLRDLLTGVPGLGTWPSDEINYIWRHGNIRHPSDRFTPEMATPAVANYIRGKFASIAGRARLETVVEKTCANSLRVGFVDSIFPDARYVFIARDGIDAAASAMKRWTAGAEFGYLARKARWVPLTDLPYYGTRFVRNRLHKLTSAEKRLAFWGPALENMQALVATRSLAEVCAVQWSTCVLTAFEDLGSVPPDRMHFLRYEELVRDPEAGLRSLGEFLGFDTDPSAVPALGAITSRMIGKGRRDLDAATIETLRPIVAAATERIARGFGS